MADNRQGGAPGASSGQGSQGRNQGSGSSGGVADQAKEALRNVTDRASDTWDDVSERGAHYYRQGSRAVGNVDSTTMTGFLIAGAIGFGIAWLIFGQRSYSGDYVTRRMSRSSERDY
ncbi:hypothetical protein [Methylobacterium nigriterrae]|uniref:hypothetical protein n=1 Tax=Methylobacterium nigriterrae TaxID=3127512 RepID=UPI003013B861